jgi:hypothetical protein
VNKFGTRDIPKLIRELRFQERRHRVFDEERLADLLRDAADSLYGRGKRTNMTSPATIASLADMIEKLTGPDREVDEEISLAFGCFPYSEDRSGNLSGIDCPAYTASLDAAMSLMPEEWLLVTLSEIAGEGMCYARLGNPFHSLDSEATGNTLVLALTAACIRALATLQGGEG